MRLCIREEEDTEAPNIKRGIPVLKYLLSHWAIYLSQLAFEQCQVTGRREDDVLTRRKGVHEPQASRLGLRYERTQLT